MYALLGISTDFFMLIIVKFKPVYKLSVQSFPTHYYIFGGLLTCNVHCSCNSLPYTQYLED